jgi:ABC-type amino acid transport substrate-binding protein
LPIARSVHAAEHGDYDGELCRTTQIESTSPHLVRVPVPVATLEYAAYVMKGTTADLSSWSAIRKSGLRVGARMGGRLTRQSLSGPQATFATSYASLLQMLLTGCIDVVVAPKGQLEQAFADVPGKLRDQLGQVQGRNAFTSELMFHYVHERNAALVEPLAREIRRIGARASARPISSSYQSTKKSGKKLVLPGFTA